MRNKSLLLLSIFAMATTHTALAQVRELPRMRLIDEGPVQLGTTAEEAAQWIHWLSPKIDREKEIIAKSLSAELVDQRVEVKVPSFYIGTHEVTNKEYLYFLQATRGADKNAPFAYRFPYNWWSAEDIASHAETMTRLKQSKIDYWENQWRSLTWNLPPELEEMPVGGISFADAMTYARWAGMSLPNEAQWMRAAVAETNDPYIASLANNDRSQWFTATCERLKLLPPDKSAKTQRPHDGICLKPVGYTGAAGASRFGVEDLHGNMVEWVDQRFLPLGENKKAFDTIRKLLKGSPFAAMADWLRTPEWQADFALNKGGSFYQAGTPNLMALSYRVDWRYPREINGWSEGLGFRLAHALTPGRDAIYAAFGRRSPFTNAYEIDFENAVGIEYWARDAKGRIAGYKTASFAPSKLEANLPADKKRAAALEPNFETWTNQNHLPIGVLRTTQALEGIDLKPGEYSVWYWNPSSIANLPQALSLARKALEKGESLEPQTTAGQEPRDPKKPDWRQLLRQHRIVPELTSLSGNRPALLFKNRQGDWACAMEIDAPKAVSKPEATTGSPSKRGARLIDMDLTPTIPVARKTGGADLFYQFKINFAVSLAETDADDWYGVR